MTRVLTQRRRVGVAVALAAAVAAVLGYGLLRGALSEERRAGAEREGIVTLRAIVEGVQRTGGSGDAVREVVARVALREGAPLAIRVVALGSLSLEASTARDDTGDRAAPRRLLPAEKPLYDLGQRLRAAVQTNREEGSARKEEIEVAPSPTGGLALAAPVESGGVVTGLVQIETAPRPPAPGAGGLAAILAFGITVLAFVAVAAAAGERRLLLLVAAAVLLAGTLAGLARHARSTLVSQRRETIARVGTTLAGAREWSARMTEGFAPAASVDPAAWDADRFRKPRATLASDGSADPAAVEREVRAATDWIRRAMAGIGVLAFAVLLGVGLGGAARLGAIVARYRHAYAYTLPAMLGMAVLVFLPFFYGIGLSFTDSNIYNSEKPLTEIWVGFRNFAEILGNFAIAKRTADGLVFDYQNFYWTLFFTVIWTVTNVAIGVTVGLVLALALNTRGLAIRPIYRVLLILPWALPNYITALTWKGMFHPQFGVVNQILQMLGAQPVAWSDRTWTSFLSILATNGWLSFPFMMVISLGALQSIPADLYEAARVDGATRWQQFRSITLPSLKPALVPAVILSVIWTFNMFNIPYLVSAGEPSHSTEILITQAYKFAFEQYRYGYAAAYSTLIFGILLLYGTWQNRVTRATEGL